jgi:hypothetical protein
MRTSLSILLIAAVAAFASADGLACGEKFFVPGRGAQFRLMPAERQTASVLFYSPATSALARTLAQLKTDAALRKAGYRPTVAATPDDLGRAAATRWDVVVVGPEDVGLIKRQIPPADQMHLIAVLANPTGAQLSQARLESAAVRLPSRNQDLLDLLDDAAARAMAERARAMKRR